MTCIHSKIRRYKVKNTNKIRWVCENCGATGISFSETQKVQPQVSVPQNQPKNNYPSISAQPISKVNPFGQSHPIGYRGISENLQSGMQDINQGIRNIPHLVIGKNKPQNPNNSNEINQNTPKNQMFSDKEQVWITKLKKWALILTTLSIVGYAGYRILFG
jgi:hypothetical protein